MSEAPRADDSPLEPEDQARAACYALLARLWYAAPDQALLDAIASHNDETSSASTPFQEAAHALARAARDADAQRVKEEFDSAFVGTGRAAVTLFLSHYLAETGRERILVALRDELAGFGLARLGTAHEPEDHFAGVLEAMRHLVGRGSQTYALECQKTFFSRYIDGAYGRLTDAAIDAADTDFYKHVARYTKAFLNVESQSFEMI
jgi:TorA maturation chaperone TorD